MIQTSQIGPLLLPGLNGILTNSDALPAEYKEIFRISPSKMAQEIDVEARMLGMADIKPQGSPLASDTMGTRFQTVYNHVTFGISFTISREALADNLYQKDFTQKSISLGNSMLQTKETWAANVLNNAFNPGFPMGDGQSLCSTSHPIDGGTYSNTFGGNDPGVDFSEFGLETALTQIEGFRSQSGLLMNCMGEKLVIPTKMRFAALRILKSQFQSETANNAITAILHSAFLKKGIVVNHYLTDPTAWFIVSNAELGLRFFEREKLQSLMHVDPATQSIMYGAYERYSAGCSNPRAIFGSKGA